MVAITEAYVDAAALNAAAIKNGKDLVKKNSFPKLCRTEDGTLLFGECKGSGKEPYRCSADWIKEDSPVYRCSCPSRQFPCKHILGLMYAYTSGLTFTVEAIPADIADKRDKAGKRDEKKKEAQAAEETAAPGKRKSGSGKAALTKKRLAQLEGLLLLEKLVGQTVRHGLASLDAKTMKLLGEQAKELGNYYVPGVQTAFRGLLEVLGDAKEREPVYTEAMDRLAALHAVSVRGRSYLEARIQDPTLPMDTETPLEEWLGHAWQLAELRELGLSQRGVPLMQLAFRSYADASRGEYVDEGFWFDLTDGRVHATRHYRPFRAAKFIKEEDTVQAVIQTNELLLYPGGLNRRVRWEEMSMREPEAADYEAIRSGAARSYTDVVKRVKDQIKNPLADKYPVCVLHYAALGRLPDGYVLEDVHGKRLRLSDLSANEQPSTELLGQLDTVFNRDGVMLVMLGHDWASGRLSAQPLSVLSGQRLIRLMY